MALFLEPVITKFLVNKIESSKAAWGDYLLEVADVFSTFDGEDLDPDSIRERFSEMSGRSIDAARDFSNFRDEFGAYGPFLGLFHYESVDGRWKVFLSNATKHFLCSTEPDVEAFCRVQLSMFQYPNGAGATIQRGNIHMQGNIATDTIREIQNNIRINPLRLLCRLFCALHEISGINLNEISVSFQTLLLLMNDDRINTVFSPNKQVLVDVLEEYKIIALPDWASDSRVLTNFKRNFHIFERTGLFKRSRNKRSMLIADGDERKLYRYISVISSMTNNFTGFEECYGKPDLRALIRNVVVSPAWGQYFDGLTLPTDVLVSLSDDIEIDDTVLNAPPIGTISISEATPFPVLSDFRTNQIRAFAQSGNRTDPIETLVSREKANREHARILSMLASKFRFQGFSVYENTFIDLCTVANEQDFIFEVKSNNSKNALSQIRKAIAQLYEYRYRSGKTDAVLCIVMQQQPTQPWVIDYLLNDRNIFICWLVDATRLECPDDCQEILSAIGII